MIHHTDAQLVEAAASLAKHAPVSMRAGHLTAPLAELAQRVREMVKQPKQEEDDDVRS